MGVEEESRARDRLVSISQRLTKNREWWKIQPYPPRTWVHTLYWVFVSCAITSLVVCMIAKISNDMQADKDDKQNNVIFYMAWSTAILFVFFSALFSCVFRPAPDPDLPVDELCTEISVALDALAAGDKTVLHYEKLLYFQNYFNALVQRYGDENKSSF